MYWFEPLHTVICNLFDVQLFIEGREQKNYTDVSLKVINSLFQCEFSDISNSILLLFLRALFADVVGTHEWDFMPQKIRSVFKNSA